MLAFDNTDKKQTEKSCQKKLREKKKKNFSNDSSVISSEVEKPISKQSKPTLEETQIYFLEKNFTEIEAQRFFNYFESNGWLVGGRTKMKDWKAAARNWMLNAKKFSKNQITDSALSSRAQSIESVLVPNHLHVTNQKNYGEAL